MLKYININTFRPLNLVIAIGRWRTFQTANNILLFFTKSSTLPLRKCIMHPNTNLCSFTTRRWKNQNADFANSSWSCEFAAGTNRKLVASKVTSMWAVLLYALFRTENINSIALVWLQVYQKIPIIQNNVGWINNNLTIPLTLFSQDRRW